jgi:hypothetical protein
MTGRIRHRRQSLAAAALTAVTLWPALSGPAAAQACFNVEETRQHTVNQNLFRLADIVSRENARGRGELVSARLCEVGGTLVYMVAMLGRDGKVHRITVDARSGDVIHRR